MGFYEKILGKKKSTSGNKVKKSDMPVGPADLISNKKSTAENYDASIWSNKGNTLVESGMYAEAIQCYDKALEINPKIGEVWNNKGLALARTGRHSEAVQCYDKALEIAPGDAEIIYNKGIALSHLGNREEAMQCYDKIVEMNPSDSSAWCSKGDVLFESGNFEEALRAYDRSIEIFPKDEISWNNRGLTLVKLNRFTEAVESYDKALEINPKIEKIWSNKGLALARMRENGDKVDLQKIATALDSGNHELKAQSSAGSMETVRESAGTITDMDKIVPGQAMEVPGPAVEEKHPFAVDTQSDLMESRAEIAAKINSDNESITEAANVGKNAPIHIAQVMAPTVIDTPPLKAETAVETTILGGEKVDKPENVEMAVQSPAIEEKVPTVIDTYPPKNETVETPIPDGELVDESADIDIAVHLSALEKEPFPDKASLPETNMENKVAKEVHAIEESKKSDPGATETRKGVRKSRKTPPKKKPPAHNTTHRYKKARETIADKSGSISSAEVEQSMGYVVSGNELFSMKKYEEAIKSFDKSLQIDPGNNTAWNNKGMALAKSGKFAEAIHCYDKALEINPDDHVVLNNKGSALYKNGCVKEAMECYESALDLNTESGTAIKGMEMCLKNLKKSMKD